MNTAVAIPAPHHHWTFTEGSGHLAVDVISAAQFSIDNDTWHQGEQGSSLRFHPDNGVRVAESSLPDLAAPWTLALSIRREANAGSSCLLGSERFAIKLEQFEGQHNLGLTAYGVGDLHFDYVTPINEWVHLCLVGTADSTSLYVNGQFRQSLPLCIELPLRWLGNSGGWTDFAMAQFDELQVFKCALDAAHIAQLAQGPGDGQPALALSLDQRSISRSGASTNWGTVAHGERKSCPLLLSNHGSAALAFCVTASDDSGQFQLTPAGTHTLAAGASMAFDLCFDSRQDGRIGLNLCIDSNDPNWPRLTHAIYANGKGARA